MSCALLVFAPHLDDAALGCAGLLAASPGARVVTLLAGFPRPGGMSTDWDAACGFASAAEAVAARRREDCAALRHLAAVPVWLDFCDGQYRQLPTIERLRDAVREQIERHAPDEVALPLGLFHSDHIFAAKACIAALQQLPGAASRWICYEDGLYRHLPGVVPRRLHELSMEGMRATPHFLSIAARRAKRDALLCYASQLRALDGAGLDWISEIEALEHYWLLEPRRQVPAAGPITLGMTA